MANVGLRTSSYRAAANGHPSVWCEGERAERNMKWYITPVFLKLNHIITLYQRARHAEELCRELRGQWNELRIFRWTPTTHRTYVQNAQTCPIHAAQLYYQHTRTRLIWLVVRKRPSPSVQGFSASQHATETVQKSACVWQRQRHCAAAREGRSSIKRKLN